MKDSRFGVAPRCTVGLRNCWLLVTRTNQSRSTHFVVALLRSGELRGCAAHRPSGCRSSRGRPHQCRGCGAVPKAIAAADRQPRIDVGVRAELFERLGDVASAARRVRTVATFLIDCITVAAHQPTCRRRIGLKRARSAARTGAYVASLRRLRRVAEALDGVAGPAAADLRAEMQVSVGFTQFQQGRLGAARVSLQDVIEHGHARRTPAVVADALAILDMVEVNLGHPVDGRRGRRALRLHERTGDCGTGSSSHPDRIPRVLRRPLDDAVGFYTEARRWSSGWVTRRTWP